LYAFFEEQAELSNEGVLLLDPVAVGRGSETAEPGSSNGGDRVAGQEIEKPVPFKNRAATIFYRRRDGLD
jgi:hypothetical protein